MCRCHVVPYPSLTIINRPSRSPAILRFTTSSSWLLLLFTTTPIWQRTQLFQQVCTALPLRHDLCLTSQLSTALLYYTLTAWYYPHHSHLLPTTTRRFTSVHYHSNLPIPPPLFVTRRSISLLQLLPIITRLCLKQYFSQVSTAPHCRNGFPYSSPLLAIAAPWVRIALF